MMVLPQIQSDVPKTKRELMALRGLNWSDDTQEGDLRHCRNLSARRWPYLSTRRGRERQKKDKDNAYAGVTALTAWGALIAVEGTRLLYDGAVVGTVTAGEKQFAVVNTKLVIWPDKVYLDMPSRTLKPLGAKVSGAGAVFTKNAVTVTGWGDLTQQFKVGDAVEITGCTAAAENNKSVSVRGVTASTLLTTDNAFTEATETGEVTVERKVPDLDFICESENRLWGCSSAKQTIYASALGDPTNFYAYDGLSTDAYAVAVGSEGDFTGCIKLSSSVLFWKETQLHKMLGSFPAEYSLYTYHLEGLKAGCHKSMQVINETLFYVGIHGVYAFTGGTPALISGCFGDRRLSQAVGGNDGDSYYLSAVDEAGQTQFLVYETKQGIWLREDATRAVDFARIGARVYYLDAAGGGVWLCDSGADDPDIVWEAQFTPLYEGGKQKNGTAVTGRKQYGRLILRLEVPRGSYLTAQVRMDGGIWRDAGKIVGREENAFSLRLPVNRCDKFELRLEGKGPCTVLSAVREYALWSDV